MILLFCVADQPPSPVFTLGFISYTRFLPLCELLLSLSRGARRARRIHCTTSTRRFDLATTRVSFLSTAAAKRAEGGVAVLPRTTGAFILGSLDGSLALICCLLFGNVLFVLL